jgi:hypothetical protein
VSVVVAREGVHAQNILRSWDVGGMKTSKCTKCGRRSDSLTIFLDPANGKNERICVQCSVAQTPEITDLEEVDLMIAQIRTTMAQSEELMSHFGNSNDDDVPAFGFTPKKIHAMLEVYLENALKDRENILAAQKGK